MDPGITVGTSKDFSLPPSYVGKSLKIIKPNNRKQKCRWPRTKTALRRAFRKTIAPEFIGCRCRLGQKRNLERLASMRRTRRFSNRAWMRSVKANCGEAQADSRRGHFN